MASSLVFIGLVVEEIGGKTRPVPLVRVASDAKIFPSHGINLSEVKIEQEYRNHSSQAINCSYLFPLAHGSSVFEYSVQINDEQAFVGQMKEKEEAQKAYQEAVAQGKTASMLEQGQIEGFKTKIGNIPAYSRIVIRLSYVCNLHTEGPQDFRFLLPTTIIPRYPLKGGKSSHAASELEYSISSTSHVPFSFKAQVIVESTELLKGLAITSPSHLLSPPQKDGASMRTSFSTDYAFQMGDSDLVLQIHKPSAPATREPQLLLDNDASLHRSLGLLADVRCPDLPSPTSSTERSQSLEFIFMLDQSGSMEGTSIKLLSEALDLMIRSLPEGSYLNLLGFGSSFKLLFPQSLPLNKSVEPALKYCKQLKANMGGTELAAPFRHLVEHVPIPKDMMRIVLLLTDGSVDNPEEVVRIVADKSDKMRVFCLGIGSGVSTHVVDEVSAAGEGLAAYCIDGEAFDSKVTHLMTEAIRFNSSDRVRDIRIELFGENAEHYEVIQNPRKHASVQAGDAVHLAALIEPRKDARLSSSALGIPDVHVIGKLHGETLFFAVNPIPQQLPLGGLLGRYVAGRLAADSSRPEAIRLSTKYSVSSPYTAFVAIDPTNRTRIYPTFIELPTFMSFGVAPHRQQGFGGMYHMQMAANAPMRAMAATSTSYPSSEYSKHSLGAFNSRSALDSESDFSDLDLYCASNVISASPFEEHAYRSRNSQSQRFGSDDSTEWYGTGLPAPALRSSAVYPAISPGAPTSSSDQKAREKTQPFIRASHPIQATWELNDELLKLCAINEPIDSVIAKMRTALVKQFGPSATTSILHAVFDSSKKLTILGTMLALAVLQTQEFASQKQALHLLLTKATKSLHSLLVSYAAIDSSSAQKLTDFAQLHRWLASLQTMTASF